MRATDKTLGDYLPKTEEELQQLIRDWDKRGRNFAKCESPIENDFLRCFYKLKADDVSVNSQVFCQTAAGRFRLDFVITQWDRKIGFECDGKEFHDEERDSIRDWAILESGFVNAIYRVPGASIWRSTNDVLDLLQKAENSLLSSRGRRNLDILINNDDLVREDHWRNNFVVRKLAKKVMEEDYTDEVDDIKWPVSLFLKWRSRENQSATS